VATEDPQGRVVAATAASGPRVWFYDAKSAALVKEKDLPTDSSYPTWSPDGTAIATDAGFLQHGLYVTDVADGAASAVVDTAYGGSGFDWSPSGIQIAYVLSTSNPGGFGKAELWVWQRGSKTKQLVSVKEFTSWSELTAWPGWIGEKPHLCSDYFVAPDPDCARATRPK
jgi:dipeptidyl aminopeptidase/acylaminoacyl peptidase